MNFHLSKILPLLGVGIDALSDSGDVVHIFSCLLSTFLMV